MRFLGMVILAAALLWGALPAEAQRLRAQVYLTQQEVPPRLSERRLLGWARRANARRLHETREAELDDREWKANLIVAFNRPPGDIEFHVLFYDTEDGSRRFLQDMSTYVNDANQETYVQRIRLERPEFKPNRRTELVVTVRRAEVARKEFHLLGEERQHSGEVSFSEEDTPEGRAAAQQAQQQEQAEPEPADEIPYEEPTMEASSVDPTEMELGPSGNAPPSTEPSAAGRSGGLCAVSGPLSGGEPTWLLFLPGLLLMGRRALRRAR